MIVKTSPCSASQLDCVEKVVVAKEECLENCRGNIMHLERLSNSVRDRAGLKTFIEEYEKFKDPHNINQYYPDAMKGTNTIFPHYFYHFDSDLKFSSKLKFVQISILSSTFDKICKEQRILLNYVL